jgi:hypothetical protein
MMCLERLLTLIGRKTMLQRPIALIATRFAGFALCLLCGLVMSGLAIAQNANIATDWNGAYYYPSGDKRSPVPFTLKIQVNGNSFTGRTTEPATFGNGTSSQLFANVSGSVTGAGINFVKTYDGTGGVSHSVQYRGTISADGTSMNGAWNIGSFSGRFSATGTNVAAATGCLIPDKVFPKGAVAGTVIWHFGNSCNTERYASVCAEYGDGQYNPLGANVPPSGGADIILREGWAKLTWKDGMGLACPSPKQ